MVGDRWRLEVSESRQTRVLLQHRGRSPRARPCRPSPRMPTTRWSTPRRRWPLARLVDALARASLSAAQRSGRISQLIRALCSSPPYAIDHCDYPDMWTARLKSSLPTCRSTSTMSSNFHQYLPPETTRGQPSYLPILSASSIHSLAPHSPPIRPITANCSDAQRFAKSEMPKVLSSRAPKNRQTSNLRVAACDR